MELEEFGEMCTFFSHCVSERGRVSRFEALVKFGLRVAIFCGGLGIQVSGLSRPDVTW